MNIYNREFYFYTVRLLYDVRGQLKILLLVTFI